MFPASILAVLGGVREVDLVSLDGFVAPWPARARLRYAGFRVAGSADTRPGKRRIRRAAAPSASIRPSNLNRSGTARIQLSIREHFCYFSFRKLQRHILLVFVIYQPIRGRPFFLYTLVLFVFLA